MESNTDLDEIRAILRDIALENKKLQKIVGEIGNKFGSFTEGMAFPSMEKVLRKRFGMTTIATRYKVHYGADMLEIDVLGLANGEVNAAVIVEVKSHLRERDIEQMLKTVEKFRGYQPEHANKKLYGILAVVDGSLEQKEKAMDMGLFVASIHDEVFDLQTAAYFVPRDFSQSIATA